MSSIINDFITRRLIPDVIYPSIFDVDLSSLYDKGVRGLILDVDNTLKPPGRSGPGEDVVSWLNSARDAGFGICLLSNSLRGHVLRFSSGLGLYSLTYARKPAAAGFLKAMRLLDCDAGQACVVGDQIFTDVLGAKRLGLMAVYVKPITRSEEITVRLKRIPESYVLKYYGSPLPALSE